MSLILFMIFLLAFYVLIKIHRKKEIPMFCIPLLICVSSFCFITTIPPVLFALHTLLTIFMVIVLMLTTKREYIFINKKIQSFKGARNYWWEICKYLIAIVFSSIIVAPWAIDSTTKGRNIAQFLRPIEIDDNSIPFTVEEYFYAMIALLVIFWFLFNVFLMKDREMANDV
ncbi:MAG: hypothetical protein HQK52_00885 [Oligoflexia bacterium]|nr:hypothetical protein [Oligoflexia bacterium]